MRTTECLMCGYKPGIGRVSPNPDQTSPEPEPKPLVEGPGSIPPWKRQHTA
ncbi:hypothetical protein [Teichococcus cervicalis]